MTTNGVMLENCEVGLCSGLENFYVYFTRRTELVATAIWKLRAIQQEDGEEVEYFLRGWESRVVTTHVP